MFKKISLILLLFLFIGAALFSLYMFYVDRSEEIDVGPYEYATLNTPVIEKGEERFSFSYDAEDLLKKNSDFLGWIAIPNTTISFPVVHGRDNQYYLSHSFDGSNSVFGCPFLDVRTPQEGEIFFIHGHNMGNTRTEMFSSLVLFQDPSYAEKHKTAYFSLTSFPEEEGEEFELFAVANISIDSEYDYFESTFISPEHRSEYISFFKDQSLYKTDFVPQSRMVILSTCNRTYGADNRLLVCFGQT